MIAEQMAEQIADAILTRSGETASRIALRQDCGARPERDLGGLGRYALIQTISDAIRALLKQPEQEKGNNGY